MPGKRKKEPPARATAAAAWELAMTGLERAYCDYLVGLRLASIITRFDFEPERLRLGFDFRTTYCPDFRLVMADGAVEFHEVKGHWREDARVKIKAAAAQHPYVFRAVTRRPQREGGGWNWETFTPGAPQWAQVLEL